MQSVWTTQINTLYFFFFFASFYLRNASAYLALRFYLSTISQLSSLSSVTLHYVTYILLALLFLRLPLLYSDCDLDSEHSSSDLILRKEWWLVYDYGYSSINVLNALYLLIYYIYYSLSSRPLTPSNTYP